MRVGRSPAASASADCRVTGSGDPGGFGGSDDPVGMSGSRARAIVTALLAVLLLASEFPLGTYLSTQDAYGGTNATLDGQKSTALGLVATATAASVTVTAITDDVGTPIAEQLADLSGKLVVVLSVIYLEKFLMTTFGLIGFRVFVPIGLGTLIAWLWTRRDWAPRPMLFVWGVRLMVVGVALATLVPVSAGLADVINAQYQSSQQVDKAVQATDTAVQGMSDNADGTASQNHSEGGGLFDMLGLAASSGIDALASGAKDAASAVGAQLNTLIDAVAVSIVTSCLVPMAVLLVYFWLIKLFTGADLTGYVTKAPAVSSGSMRRATMQ